MLNSKWFQLTLITLSASIVAACVGQHQQQNNNYNTGSSNGCNETLRKGTINGKRFPKKENATGYRVGDKVSIKEYKTLYDPHKKRQNKQGTAVHGVVVGHTRHYVDVAIEHSEEGSIILRHVRKKNHNVLR